MLRVGVVSCYLRNGARNWRCLDWNRNKWEGCYSHLIELSCGRGIYLLCTVIGNKSRTTGGRHKKVAHAVSWPCLGLKLAPQGGGCLAQEWMPLSGSDEQWLDHHHQGHCHLGGWSEEPLGLLALQGFIGFPVTPLEAREEAGWLLIVPCHHSVTVFNGVLVKESTLLLKKSKHFFIYLVPSYWASSLLLIASGMFYWLTEPSWTWCTVEERPVSPNQWTR